METEDRFEDFLNECYGTVELMGIEYDYARVLKSVDEVAYRQAFLDWEDNEYDREQAESDEQEDPITVEVLDKNLTGFRGEAWLLQSSDGRYFIASGTNVPMSGWEVLVFPATSDGDVSNWGEVAGGRGISMEDAVLDLEEQLND